MGGFRGAQEERTDHSKLFCRSFAGFSLTVGAWPQEHAQKNMDPERAETQSEATFCSKHNKNIDPQCPLVK